ncbi:MAG: hypothetical protein AAB564_00840 [Patescibacteria group bacterium]
MNMNKSRLIFASALAAIVSIAFTVVITVWAELSTPLKDWLKNFSGHHWTSKSIFSVLLFIIAVGMFYFPAGSPSDNHLKKILNFLLFFTVLGVIIIAVFYTGHHFKFF